MVPDVGGGFGVKSRTIGEELTLGWLSRHVGRPVRFTETRTESMQALPQGRGQRIDLTHRWQPRWSHHCVSDRRRARCGGLSVDGCLPADDDATDDARRLRHRQLRVPAGCRWRPTRCRSRRTAGPAGQRPPWPSSGQSTTSPPRSAWTRPKCAGATSFPSSSEPYTTGIGTVYDVGDYGEAMRRVLEAADYTALARRAGRAAGQRLDRAHGHRARRLRRDHLGGGAHRVRRCSSPRRWADAGAHRRHAVRAGSRHHLEDDHRRSSRRADGGSRCRARRHRRSAFRWIDRRDRGRCRSPARHW